VSVIGDDADERTTLRGLVSARGFLQTLIAKQLEVRQCPLLRLHLDRGFKLALETIRRIDASRQEAGAAADRDGSFDSGPEERTSDGSPTP
jgi:ribosome-binding factor A